MPRFKEIRKRYDWRPIRGCPGRFVLEGGPSEITPEELTGKSLSADLTASSMGGDPVTVIAFEGGGVISYLKSDGRYIHTLCTKDGFRRKLRDL